MSRKKAQPNVVQVLDDPLFSPEDVATGLKTNVRTLERWRATGQGPAFGWLRAPNAPAFLRRALP